MNKSKLHPSSIILLVLLGLLVIWIIIYPLAGGNKTASQTFSFNSLTVSVDESFKDTQSEPRILLGTINAVKISNQSPGLYVERIDHPDPQVVILQITWDGVTGKIEGFCSFEYIELEGKRINQGEFEVVIKRLVPQKNDNRILQLVEAVKLYVGCDPDWYLVVR